MPKLLVHRRPPPAPIITVIVGTAERPSCLLTSLSLVRGLICFSFLDTLTIILYLLDCLVL